MHAGSASQSITPPCGGPARKAGARCGLSCGRHAGIAAAAVFHRSSIGRFGGCCLAAPADAAANGALRDELQRGYDLAYNLNYDEAVAALTRAIESDPQHPGGYRGIAAITWLQILFLRGGVLVDSYLSDTGGAISRRRVRKPKPPAELAARFESHIERAVALSEEAVDRAPDDPDAHYELGASVALAASYRASIEGDALGALRQAKEAYTAHQTVLELDPRRKDANLTLGIYRYLVSLLPRAFRVLAYLVGFDGGKAEAIRLIEEAAAYPGDTRSEAQFALVLLYNRERQYGAAQRVLGDLRRRFPRNRLVWLSASTWLRDERPRRAERAIVDGFARLERDARVRMEGEQAVWHLKRAAARVAGGRIALALPDLEAAETGAATPWVTGQAQIERGKIADLEGDRRRARDAYERGRKLCGEAKHRRCAAEAERLKRHGYPLDKDTGAAG